MTRGRFQGAIQILRYNWDFYAVATAGALLALALAFWLVDAAWLKPLLITGSGASLLWMVASLLASHYVYDRSPLYRWQWVAALLPRPPARWLSIHAGLDESSTALQSLFPASQGVVLDIYDPTVMTERSIAHARQLSSQPPATRADFCRLPLPDSAMDAVFVLFTAHELRRPQARRSLFRELLRVLRPEGSLLLVEHLRDFKNFLVFGPGSLHFYPRREWVRLTMETGLRVEREFAMTPFVRVFLLTPRNQTSDVA